MNHRPRIVEVLYRAETGPIMEEADFERKLVAPSIKAAVEKYNIKFDGETAVNSDDDLADRVFQAGFGVARDVGLFCQDTSRRIVWSEKELEAGLRYCPSEVTMGLGVDAVTLTTRRPEDTKRVGIVGGAYGVPVPEHMYLPMALSYLKQPIFDSVDNPSLETVYGHPKGKPFEEVYNMETVEPTAEWQGIYDEVREELVDMGLPMDRMVW